MNELIALIAVGSAVTGATLKTIQSKLDKGEDYSFKKLAGALMGSAMLALSVVNLAEIQNQVSTLGYVGLFVLNALAGAGIASTLAAAHKSKIDE